MGQKQTHVVSFCTAAMQKPYKTDFQHKVTLPATGFAVLLCKKSVQGSAARLTWVKGPIRLSSTLWVGGSGRVRPGRLPTRSHRYMASRGWDSTISHFANWASTLGCWLPLVLMSTKVRMRPRRFLGFHSQPLFTLHHREANYTSMLQLNNVASGEIHYSPWFKGSSLACVLCAVSRADSWLAGERRGGSRFTVAMENCVSRVDHLGISKENFSQE